MTDVSPIDADNLKEVRSRILIRMGLVTLCLLAAGLPAMTENTDECRLVAEFDCTKDYPEDVYFGHGSIHVVGSSIGGYREAEGRPLSRFGYRFEVERMGRPHLAVVRYPDDKRRFMCVMDGTCYDLTTGVYTGFEHPVSGTMQEIK